MRSAAELQRDAWEAIIDRLGIADALRYRALSGAGTGDDARERDRMFAGMSIDAWILLAKAADEQHQGEASDSDDHELPGSGC